MHTFDQQLLLSSLWRTPKKRSTSALTYRLIDLFAGAGGMTLGFTNVGFVPVWANDYNDYAVETYNRNFGKHCISGDIVSILKNPDTYIPPADVVIGGPPCQGFSLLNRNRDGDARKTLWRPYLDIVEKSGATVFVMENVPELLKSTEFEDILAKAQEIGFNKCNIWHSKLCAADYGVPQIRWRAFIVGCKFGDPHDFFPPKKTHYNTRHNGSNKQNENGVRPWTTVRDFIQDMSPPEGTEIRSDIQAPYDIHFGRTPTLISLERYKTVANEGDNRFTLQRLRPDLTPQCWIKKTSGGTDLFGRLWWDRPAFTIRTEFFKPEKGRYLHPEQHRPITHREAALLQSFPPEFQFYGSKIEVAKQIGNAVPPILATHIAECVATMLKNKPEEHTSGQFEPSTTSSRDVICKRTKHSAGNGCAENDGQLGLSLASTP